MLSKLSLLFLIVAGAAPIYSPFLPVLQDLQLSNAQVKRYFFEDSKEYVSGTCNSVQFASAQAGFAAGVGLPETTTWRDAQKLTDATLKMLDSGVDSIAKVCGTRQLFAQTLGQTYDSCTNRFYLIGLGNTDFFNVMMYTHLMKHLEFICSTGFDVYQKNVDCIRKGETTDGNLYKACFYKFNATIQHDPNHFCSATETFVGCIKDFFSEECNPTVGWMECELERIGFANECFNLAC